VPNSVGRIGAVGAAAGAGGLIEQRQKFGFRVVFAYVDDTNNDLVWAVEHDGDFAAAEAEYMGSPERAATLAGAPQVMKGAKVGRATRVM
jgi:hypothetical protein